MHVIQKAADVDILNLTEKRHFKYTVTRVAAEEADHPVVFGGSPITDRSIQFDPLYIPFPLSIPNLQSVPLSIRGYDTLTVHISMLRVYPLSILSIFWSLAIYRILNLWDHSLSPLYSYPTLNSPLHSNLHFAVIYRFATFVVSCSVSMLKL